MMTQESAPCQLQPYVCPALGLFIAFVGFPVAGAADCFLPAGVEFFFRRFVQLWFEFALDHRLAAQLFQAAPEAARQARQVGRAQRSGFAHLRALNLSTEDVGLELHQEVVRHGTAVDAQGFQSFAGILLHSIEYVAGLVGNRLQVIVIAHNQSETTSGSFEIEIAAGTHTIGFAATNEGDTGVDLTLTIDNITIEGGGSVDTETVTVTVNPVNDAPVTVADTATTEEDTAVSIDVLANDSDVDADSLSVSAVTQGANGTVAIDVETGEEIWRDRMPFAANSVPMTYRLRKDSRQFIVTAAGGNPLGDMGDAVIAYALPKE